MIVTGQAAKAALAYWVLVFALGFVLGSIRVLFLVGAIGVLPATLVELPLMLAASWLAARWLARRLGLSSGRERLAMGALAFALLMASELVLTAALPGDTPAQWIARMATLPGAIGLAGQLAFALMPWLAVRASR